MGMFSKNTTSLGNYNSDAVVAREGYEGSFGAALIMIESAINEEKFFAHLIMKDQSEAMAAVKGIAVDESVEVLTEGISEFAAGLKKMIMAAWEKIKGLWKSFIAKFDSVIMRDTKALFNKHKTEFVKNTGKLKKWKWAEKKQEFNLDNRVDSAYKELEQAESAIASDREKLQDRIDDGDLLDTVLSGYLSSGTTTRKEFSKDLHDDLFESEETYTDEAVSSTVRAEIMTVLQNNKLLDNLKKGQTAIDKAYSKLLHDIDKTINDYAKDTVKDAKNPAGIASVDYKRSGKSSKDPGRDSSVIVMNNKGEGVMQELGTLRAAVTQYQIGANMFSSAVITETKFHIKQCRRVFGQIISMRSSKNEAVLLDAIGESIEYDIDSSFEDYEI